MAEKGKNGGRDYKKEYKEYHAKFICGTCLHICFVIDLLPTRRACTVTSAFLTSIFSIL